MTSRFANFFGSRRNERRKSVSAADAKPPPVPVEVLQVRPTNEKHRVELFSEYWQVVESALASIVDPNTPLESTCLGTYLSALQTLLADDCVQQAGPEGDWPLCLAFLCDLEVLDKLASHAVSGTPLELANWLIVFLEKLVQNYPAAFTHPAVQGPFSRLLYHGSHNLDQQVDSVLYVDLLCEVSKCLLTHPHLCEAFLPGCESVDVETKYEPENGIHQSEDPDSYNAVSGLLRLVHTEGEAGMRARDGIIAVSTATAKDERLCTFIVHRSKMFQMLAVQLGAMYSILRAHLDPPTSNVDRIMDQLDSSTLRHFLEMLRFCNDVARVSPPVASQALSKEIYQVFLISIMLPALAQKAVDTAVIGTVYLDQCFQACRDRALADAFARFVATEQVDGCPLVDLFVQRVHSEDDALRCCTLKLLNTMVGTGLEVLLRALVLGPLLTGHHLLLDPPPPGTEDEDIWYARQAREAIGGPRGVNAASRFRALTNGAGGFLSPDDSTYMAYVSTAETAIDAATRTCAPWIQGYLTVDCSAKEPNGTDANGVTPTVGLIPNLLIRLAKFLETPVTENFLVTGVISKLCAYPIPLIRSLLLDPFLRVKPEYATLYSVLEGTADEMEGFARNCPDFDLLIAEARRKMGEESSVPSNQSSPQRRGSRPTSRRSSLKNQENFQHSAIDGESADNLILSEIPSISPVQSTMGFFNSFMSSNGGQEDAATLLHDLSRMERRALANIVVYEEFVKELAAFAQEHALMLGLLRLDLGGPLGTLQ